MTTELIVTGTGMPRVAPGRAGPGVYVRHGDIRLQFDAGRATSLRLIEAGVAAEELTAFFATHHHSDHLTGLTDLVFTRWIQSQTGHVPLPIIVPRGPALTFAQRMLEPWSDDIAVRLSHTGRPDGPEPQVIPFEPPSEPTQIWAQGDVRVLVSCVHHEPVTPSVGYRIETPDGVIAISGDTVVCDEVAELARDANILVHEAFRVDLLRPTWEKAPQARRIAAYHADTAKMGLFDALGLDVLLLTHLIPAPPDEAAERGFFNDVRRAGYTGEVIVARDLERIVIEDGRCLHTRI